MTSKATTSMRMKPITALERWKMDFSKRRLERNRFNPIGGMR
jgi:hypothetical protein